MKISKDTLKYNTKEDIDLAISLLEELQGKSTAEIEKITRLMRTISEENSFLAI